MSKYLVTTGMQGGYMPNDVIECDTKAEAYGVMRDLAREYRQDGFVVTGSARNGVYACEERGRPAHSLGFYIELSAGE